MKNQTTAILLTAVIGAVVLLACAVAQAQTSSTTGDENTYQLAFIDIGFQIFDIVLNFLLLLMQQVLTGFFGIFI